jgi:hypothetical protein
LFACLCTEEAVSLGAGFAGVAGAGFCEDRDSVATERFADRESVEGRAAEADG